MKSIQEFINKYKTCQRGQAFLATQATLEGAWLHCPRALWILFIFVECKAMNWERPIIEKLEGAWGEITNYLETLPHKNEETAYYIENGKRYLNAGVENRAYALCYAWEAALTIFDEESANGLICDNIRKHVNFSDIQPYL